MAILPTTLGVTGLTSKQLRSGLPAGFSSYFWGEKKRSNNGFPYLLAMQPDKKMTFLPVPVWLTELQLWSLTADTDLYGNPPLSPTQPLSN